MSRIQKIAHRGASGYAPENTMASFSKALEMGARSIEFDVQQTLDHRLVVIHDVDLRRVAGVKKSVGDLKCAEMNRLDVGSWFAPEFKDERVPLLEDLIRLTRGGNGSPVELQLEIKNDGSQYDGIERRVLDLLASERRNGVVISSFDHPTLFRVRELDAKARLGYLAGLVSLSRAMKDVEKLDCESVHLSCRRVNAAWVRAAKALGKKVLVYTVNTSKELSRMIALGVDGVFTNYPDLEPL